MDYSFSLEDEETAAEDVVLESADETKKQSNLVVHVSPREDLPDKRPAIVANIAKIRNQIVAHLEHEQCFILYYGHAKTELPEFVKLAESVEAVVLCSTDASAHRTVTAEQVPDALSKGYSVVMCMGGKEGYTQLGIALSGITNFEDIDCRNIRTIVVIDKTSGFLIGKLVRTPTDDYGYFADTQDMSSSGKKFKFEILNKYNPQIIPQGDITPDSIKKKWECEMSCHRFRNSLFPSIYNENPGFLDNLGFCISYIPFSIPIVYAVTLLPDKGEEAKSLLEAWVNYTIGTLNKFIKAE